MSLTENCLTQWPSPQELTYWAEGSSEHQLRRNTLDAIPTLYEDAFNDPGEGWEGSGALGHAVTSPGASPGPSPLSSPVQPPLSPGDPAHILHGSSPAPSQKESGKGSDDGDSIFSVKGISSKLPSALTIDLWGRRPPCSTFRAPFVSQARACATCFYVCSFLEHQIYWVHIFSSFW